MSLATDAASWRLFLGVPSKGDAGLELRRMVERLDDAHDVLDYVIRLVSGCPDSEVEEDLRFSRKAVADVTHRLQMLVLELRLGDPTEVA
jgi:hypothetical protein